MGKFKMVVLTNPAEGHEDEFNEWYTNKHLQDVVAIPGIQTAQRFRLMNAMGFEHRQRYLAVYEIESENPEAVVEELLRRSGTAAMYISAALDMETAVGGLFEPCSPVVTAAKAEKRGECIDGA